MKDPAVLFYTSDFLMGVTFFTMEQRGQYITLLCEQHQHGGIPENHMISICGSLDSPVVKKFARDENGLFFNERMRDEAIKRLEYCKSKSHTNSGRKKKESYDLSYDYAHGNHSEDENRNENEDINTNTNPEIKNNQNTKINSEEINKIVQQYNSTCTGLTQVINITPKRQGYVNARIREYGIDKVFEMIDKASRSQFLAGQNSRGWVADFEWIMKPGNFIKVLEGKYDSKSLVNSQRKSDYQTF